MGRPVLLYFTCLLVCILIVLKAWNILAEDSTRAAILQSRAAATAGGTTEKGLQGGGAAASSTVQGIQLSSMPAYKHYWVGNSTIPGAGLGVFARTNLPAGTIWNPEDAEPSSTLALTLPLWQALTGLVQRLKAAGHQTHPVAAVWSFYDVHAYMCEDKYIVALTGSTFNNHGPEQPLVNSRSSPPAAAAAATGTDSLDALTAQTQASAPSVRRRRFANTGALDGEWPVQKQRRALGVTAWQICTVLVTLRDITAGEELIEDYSEYDPPCLFRGDCPQVLNLPPPDEESRQYYTEWLRPVLVSSPDVYVSNSSSPGGALGVFAARDLPAGTVWNKEDAAHALAVTRGQWTRLLQLHLGLAASGVNKPIVSQTVEAFRSHGFCCPLDGRMYVPFTTSLLAKRQMRQASSALHVVEQGSGTSSSGKQKQRLQGGLQLQRVNSMHVGDAAAAGGAAGISASAGPSVTARCTWLRTAADVKKGEELVVARGKQFECDWPGMQQ